jgi:hypothetical protein
VWVGHGFGWAAASVCAVTEGCGCSVTKPIEEVTTKPAVTKPNKGGRPRVGVEVMTVAERVARHRAKRRDG